MSFQYDFPSELLLAIFGKVEAYEDLLTIAATCRRFNHLSLQVFFSNHKFDPNSKTIILRPYDRSLEMISALAMSLALQRTSLEYLSFKPGCVYDIHRIHTLTRYIMNLKTIDRVTLHITLIPGYVTAAGDWKAAYVAFLETVIGKSCSNLHVETYQLSTGENEHNDLLSISKTLGWFRIPGRVKKSNGEVKHLKDCFIRTFPTFLRPFYLRVLKANAPVLTSLVFQSIFGRITAIDWGFLIANVHLPVLKRFATSFGDNIPRDAIIKFLSKHSHLTTFEYHNIKYTPEPKGVPRGLDGVFNHLERLTTDPKHILRFMPTMDRMPRLASVTIMIENGHMDFSVLELLEQALRRLSSCTKKIELTWDISGKQRLKALPELLHLGSSFRKEDGFMLRCVESFHILWEWRYTANDLGRVTTWIKRFPELKKLALNSIRPISLSLVEERNTLPLFFEQVKLACPTIESISLHGESEWTLLDKYSSSKFRPVHWLAGRTDKANIS